MITRLFLLLFFSLSLVACQAMVDRAADDIAQQVSDQVSEQLSTVVAEQVGTAIAGRDDIVIADTNADAVSAAPAPITYSCERKRCTEMTTCLEALFQLNFCGHVQLDIDKDGIPCESICSRSDVDSLAAGADAPEQTAAVAIDKVETGPVTRVIDGDTIDVLIDGKNTRIRYLQINTPERDEPCYREATQANANLVAGKTVRLVADRENADRYDRLLRFVYVDEVLVNRALVEDGYAEVVLYPPNDARFEEFRSLEAEAAQAGRGCHPTGIFDDGSQTR